MNEETPHRRGLEPEIAHPIELELGPNLDVQLEFNRTAFFELEIADGGVRDRLERLAGLGGLPTLADDFLEHRLADGVTEGGADAVLAASIFHFGQHTIPEAKAFMKAQGIEVRD